MWVSLGAGKHEAIKFAQFPADFPVFERMALRYGGVSAPRRALCENSSDWRPVACVHSRFTGIVRARRVRVAGFSGSRNLSGVIDVMTK